MTENEFKNRIIESALTPNARLVAFVLLQYRNRISGDCYPSQVTLSESCGLTKNTIIRAIRELEDCGYISINQKRLKGHKFTCNFYVFEFQSSTIEPSNDPSNDRSNDPSNDGAIIAPKPIKPIKPKKDIIARPDDVDDSVWEDFITHRRSKKATISETVIKQFRKEATKAGVSLQHAIEVCIARGWQGYKAEWDSVKPEGKETYSKSIIRARETAMGMAQETKEEDDGIFA